MNIGPSGSIPARNQVSGSRSTVTRRVDLSASSDLPEAVFAELRRPSVGKGAEPVGQARFELSLSQASSDAVRENSGAPKTYVSTRQQTVSPGRLGALIDVVA